MLLKVNTIARLTNQYSEKRAEPPHSGNVHYEAMRNMHYNANKVIDLQYYQPIIVNSK